MPDRRSAPLRVPASPRPRPAGAVPCRQYTGRALSQADAPRSESPALALGLLLLALAVAWLGWIAFASGDAAASLAAPESVEVAR